MTGDAEEAARGLAQQHGLRYVDLSRAAFAPGAASLLPEETARRFRAVPIERRRHTTVVAVADPADRFVMNALRTDIDGEFVTVVAPLDQVTAAIARVYGGGQIRTGRHRGQHVAGDDPSVDGVEAPDPRGRFASADAILQGTGGNGSAGRGTDASDRPVTNGVTTNGSNGRHGPAAREPEMASGAATDGASSLEDALRDILAPPEIDHSMPSPPSDVAPPVFVPSPPAAASPPAAPAPQTSTAPDGAGVPSSPNGSSATSAPVATPVAPPAPEGVEGDVAEKVTATGPPATEPTGTEPPPPPPGYGAADAAATAAPTALPAGADLHWPPLARVLVTSGKVSYDDMVRALRAHREAGDSLARYLYNQHLSSEEDLVEAMAEEVGLEFVDLSTYPPDPAAAALVPEAVAKRHMVLPIRIEHGVPVVAMANPTDVFAMDDLRSIMGRNFTPVVSTRSQIAAHLRHMQDSGTDMEEVAQSAAGVVGHGAAFELESLQSVVEDAPIVRYVNLLILQALNERASDIHIEPTPKRLRIRFRIDGVMHDASSASPAIHASVLSRLKVLGEMDITEHRVPQEGRVSVGVGDRQIDLRLATLPTLYGESCVMRLLDKTASIRKLSELGFLADTAERYAQTYNHPYGVILVTGPTGAGKTTTLYATLQEVMSKEKSVVTVEDPVEYQIDGITQVQINPKVGLQFSTALRSILRADPDIILVGEIRDIETATIAMEAALSGHLVLSTLHTNTAASTPLRLTEMGIEPFLVTSAVGGVLTQRLARVLCERCKTPYDASPTDFYAAGYRESDLEGLDSSTLYRANGCRSCSHTGYHGRMVLAEVMQVTEEIERMIIEQQSIVAMERQAVEQGMRTLRQDGLLKALMGVTTLEEVLRVVV